MSTIEISVIIPTFNRADSLHNALNHLLMQTLNEKIYEIIIVNDGSSDSTAQMVKELSESNEQIKYLFQQNKGPAAARNKGIQMAKGKIIAFTDDDCEVDKNWLKSIKLSFEKDPFLVGLQGSTHSDKNKVNPLTHQVINENGNHAIPTCNAAYLRSEMIKINGFDDRFPYPHNEDTDVAWRIADLGKLGFNSEMKVYHPPRQDTFKKVASRMKIFSSEFALYHKHKKKYETQRASNPWKTIYHNVFIVNNIYQLKQSLKNWRRPKLMVTSLLLVCIWWFDLIKRFPEYKRADRYFAKIFN